MGMSTEAAPAGPVTFGRYTLLERLAVGGMAEVFRAKISSSHGFEKILVIKRILPHLAADPGFVTMFIDEAKLTAQLTHPKIVQILDFGEVDGQYFIALEYIDGFDALGLLRTRAQKKRARAAGTSRCSSSRRCSRRSTTPTTRATWKASRCRSSTGTSRRRTSSSPGAAT